MTSLKPLGNSTVARTLSKLYLFGVHIRNRWYDQIPSSVHSLDRFTITIGGIHAGGTGKTPLCLLIGNYCADHGYDIALLSRGYGRINKKPLVIAPHQHTTWIDVGDEPTLFHQHIPSSWLGISANRIQVAADISKHLAAKAVYILDDGFQYRPVLPHRAIICLPKSPFDDYPIPQGYLREDFQSLRRAHCVCLIGQPSDSDTLYLDKKQILSLFPHLPVFILFQEFDQWVDGTSQQHLEKPPFRNPLILSGISRPERFFEMVRNHGIVSTSYACFEDHHRLNEKDIAMLCTAGVDGIITTEKDFMRLSTINLVNCPNICYLKIKLLFESSAQRDCFFVLLFGNR